jgi:CO/xanthine dehydrogenase FAD-binding subunit
MEDYLESTELPPAHVVTMVSVRHQSDGRWHYEKLAVRAHSWPLVSVAARQEGGVWSVALAGQSIHGQRCPEAEQIMKEGGGAELAAAAARERIHEATGDGYVRLAAERLLTRSLRLVVGPEDRD